MRSAVASLTLLLALVPGWGSAQEINLTPRFSPGGQFRYRLDLTVETESNLSPAGEALTGDGPLRLALVLTWRVQTLDVAPSGATRLRAVIEGLQVETTAPGAQPPEGDDFVGQAVTYRFFPDGRVDEIEAPEEWMEEGQPAAWLRSWVEQAAGVRPPEVPEKLLPGKSWRHEQEIEVPGLPRQRLVAENEYLRAEEFAGRPCAAILTRFELGGEDKEETTHPDRTVTQTERQVQGGGSRLSCYELASGRLLESTQKSEEQIRMVIRAPGSGPSEARPALVLESSTKTESHLRLIE